MKPQILLQAFFVAVSISCSGQTNTSPSAVTRISSNNSCHRPAENKTIGICNIKTDTLTYDQFGKCSKLTIDDDNKEVISSYKFGYSSGISVFVLRQLEGNLLPKDMVTTIIKDRINKIIISDIKGDNGKEKFDLGFRCFYLK